MVIATHSYSIVDGGKLGKVLGAGMYGVQTFFTVSAATLMIASARRKDLDILPFAIRRVARIAPLYFVGMVFYLMTPVMLDQRHHPGGILLNIFFVHGFVPSFQNNIVPGGWSIGCEMAFYALFPLLFRVISDQRRAFGFVAITWAIDILLLILGRTRGWSMESSVGLFYHPVFQMPSFATGIAVYHLTKNRLHDEERERWPFHLSTFAGLVGMIAFYSVSHHHAWALPPVSLCVGLFVYGCLMAPPWWLVRAPMVRLGLISFSMYIWHFAVMFGLLGHLPIAGIHLPGQGSPVTSPGLMLMAFVLTLAISWPLSELSRRWIELPGMELGRTLIERVRERRFAAETQGG